MTSPFSEHLEILMISKKSWCTHLSCYRPSSHSTGQTSQFSRPVYPLQQNFVLHELNLGGKCTAWLFQPLWLKQDSVFMEFLQLNLNGTFILNTYWSMYAAHKESCFLIRITLTPSFDVVIALQYDWVRLNVMLWMNRKRTTLRIDNTNASS